MKEKPSCKQYVFTGDEISPEVRKIFNSDKIAELAGEWGNPGLGSPIQYQWARTELESGQSCEIEVRNLAIMIFHSDDKKKETIQVHYEVGKTGEKSCVK